LILICAGDAAGAAMAAELAAIAAAAIARGAVALPDAGAAGAAALASVVGTVTARTTATGFGVVTEGAPGVTEAVEESAAEAVLEDGLSIDFAVPFALSDFALDPWAVSALALAPLSALFLAEVLRSSELFLAAWSEAAASRDRVLSADAAASSARGCRAGGCWGAGCCCAVEVALALLASAAAELLSISAPKLPKLSSCDGSGRTGFGGAV
jgi:hypothetical protein